MSSRIAAALVWLIPVTLIVGSCWWIDRRAGWDAVFAPAAAPESDRRERRDTTVFAVDSSADGEKMLVCLRGHLSHGAPLLIFAADGQARRIPAAEAFISRTVLWNAALFPDGGSLLVAGGPAGLARIDLRSGKISPLARAPILEEGARVVIARDGQTLAVELPDEIVLLDAAAGTERARLPAPGADVTDVVFSPDGRLLATGRADGQIQVWEVATGALQRCWRGHTRVVGRLRFVGDGSRLASVGLDGTFRLWETETGREVWSDAGDGNGLLALAIAPDGVTAAVGGFGTDIHIWDLGTGRREQTLTGHTRAIRALQFIRGGTVLASASYDGTIRYWDAAGDFACVGWDDLGGGPFAGRE
jgi:hypothetical protein